MLGLELQDAFALAVSVDAGGAVVARALVDVSSDLTAAARAALDAVTKGSPDAAPLGVASTMQDSPALTLVLADLAQRFHGPFVQHGAMPSGTAAAVAEAWVGAAKDVKDVVFFAVDHHTIGGVIRQGVPLRGSHGFAASVAWLSLNPVEREDYRKIGCLEAETAAAGIVRRLIWRIKAGDRSRVQDIVGDDFSKVTLAHILDAARNNDGVSFSVVRDTAKYLGMAAANLVVVTDPEMLVLGGIMAASADLFLEPMRAEISRRLPRAMMDALSIVPATLGADAPAIGAARLTTPALQP